MKLLKNSTLSLVIILGLLLVITGAFYLYNGIKVSRRPNVILITIDALRPDHLNCYGYEKNISPNIDYLAKEGILFTQAISQASWTGPSITSLITSTYPSTHKVYFSDQFLCPDIPNFPRLLKERGYNTSFISAHILFSHLEKNFDFFKTIYHKYGDKTVFGKGDKITQKAINWIVSKQNEPFFLWLHYMDVHNHAIGIPNNENKLRNKLPFYISLYDNAINFVDSQIGDLTDKLKKLGLYKNTLFIITADHGEGMGEHGMFFKHASFLWDSLLKVPLIIRYPEKLPENKKIHKQVELIDIGPTICELLKIKEPNSFEGESLLFVIGGSSSHTYVFSEEKKNVNYKSANMLVYSKYSIRSKKYKLIFTLKNDEEKYELYNLKKDPLEKNNIIGKKKKIFVHLKNKLSRWRDRKKYHKSKKRKKWNKEEIRKLKSLGYFQ